MKHRLSVFFAGLLLAVMVTSSTCSAAAPPPEGAKIGQWKTWNLDSVDEITVPAPPADTSDQTKAELEELRHFQGIRSNSPPITAILASWNGLAAVKRWTDAVNKLPLHPTYLGRISAYTHTAILDAVVVAYHAKYTYNRKAPAELATGFTPFVATTPGEPSYPSEYAAIAGAASTVLSAMDPANAATYQAMAQDEALSRVYAGTNYRSDVDAGLALGKAVAEKALARAKTDGSDAVSTDPWPTGSGIWGGKTTVGRMKGTWRPWLMTSGDQFRPAPPPAFGSPEFNAALAEVKRRTTSVTAAEKSLSDFWLAASLYQVWDDTAYNLMAQEKASPARAARLMAAVQTSADDAVIACWDSKFHFWLLRPIEADPTIPLLTPTPPYPAYTSGFSALTGGLSEPIALFFPQEAARLRATADQAITVRIIEGIHYRFDCEEGIKQGRLVAALGADRDKANDQ